MAEGQVQGRLQFPRGLEAIVRRRRGRPFDHLDEGVGQLGLQVAQLPERHPRLVLAAHVGAGLRCDRERPGDEMEQQDAGAVDVAARRSGLAVEDLRRQVQRRASEAAAGGFVGLHVVAGTEVHQHGAPAGGPHHVLGLDVAVDEPGAVHRRQGPGDVDAEQHRLARIERSLLRHQLLERAALQQLHRNADVAADAVGAEDPDDIRMAELGEQPRIVQRPVGVQKRRRLDGTDDLERHVQVRLSSWAR